MASTLTLTDGTTTVNLLQEGSAYQLLEYGWLQGDPDLKQIRRDSMFAEGEALVSSQAKNVIETYRVALEGASHDAVATSLQALATLAKNAIDYHVTDWQWTPVYLTAKTYNETNTRYALVFQIRVKFDKAGLFDKEFANERVIPGILVTVEREPYWRGAAPNSLPTALTLVAPDAPSPQADATEQFAANFRHTNALTHIYNFDASGGGSFSANLIASSSFNYFEVAASTPDVGDILYIGSTTGPFFNAILNVGTAGSITGLTTVEEWWSGAAWSSHAAKLKIEPTFTGGLIGLRTISFDGSSDWAATTINGVSAYWIRVRIAAITLVTTKPAQAGQVLYTCRNSYFEIGSTQIDGDVDALIQLRHLTHGVTNDTVPDWIAIGMKSRGLSNFTSRLNAGGQNPAGWTETYGTNTAQTADPTAPGGNNATCTFATDQTLVTRTSIGVSSATIEPDFEGQYRVYLRCQQTGGSAGAVSVRFQMQHSVVVNYDTVALRAVSAGIEVVYLGLVRILAPHVFADDERAILGLTFAIQASATSATPDLAIYDLVLIPTDEWSFVASSQGLANQAIGVRQMLEIDNGIRRKGVTEKLPISSTGNPIVVSEWQARGDLPHLPPNKQMRLYFLWSGLDPTVPISPNGHNGGWQVRAHERWVFMRGSE